MKHIYIISILFLFMACSNSKPKKQTVELSCGQCQFGLTSQKGCDLAVRINEKAYFVDGADIDEFGDAHDENSGFCEVIRKAEVEGELINNRFKVTTVKLLD
ncbi:DUF6370 family protein [Confluentibacter flavum]|uniref:Uncharacterized protein n=1 Tax=Confluentibacter flavum TaxID=1909700 RepID=A0A2N3HIT2_9FLAO|nr:DUF6370 family protein [Confluentibacter flavum]PKQ44890.1 hypothetical protein CSW08_10790 [Confluentibacter flavum]